MQLQYCTTYSVTVTVLNRQKSIHSHLQYCTVYNLCLYRACSLTKLVAAPISRRVNKVCCKDSPPPPPLLPLLSPPANFPLPPSPSYPSSLLHYPLLQSSTPFFLTLLPLFTPSFSKFSHFSHPNIAFPLPFPFHFSLFSPFHPLFFLFSTSSSAFSLLPFFPLPCPLTYLPFPHLSPAL